METYGHNILIIALALIKLPGLFMFLGVVHISSEGLLTNVSKFVFQS